MKKALFLLSIIALILAGCSKPAETTAMAAAPKSDGSEDLIIDAQIDLAGNESANHFNWKGNVRYMAAEDSYDAASGASLAGSTHLFMAYLYDVEGKPAMSTALRGLFLFGVNGADQVEKDNLHAFKNSDGSIIIRYVHRGTAYRFTTDSKGILSLPDGSIEKRSIGTPKELEAEFTSDGTAQGVDFDKVFSSDVAKDGPAPDSMFFFDGDLQVKLENDLLTLKGILTAVKR